MAWDVGRIIWRNGTASAAGRQAQLEVLGGAVQDINSDWGWDYRTFNGGSADQSSLLLTHYGASYSITGVNQGTKTFTINGDHTSELAANMPVEIRGSTGNDDTYYVASFSLESGPTTDIVVNETIPDSTSDGTIYIDASSQVMFVSGSTNDYMRVDNTYNDGNIDGDVGHLLMSFKPGDSGDFYDPITDTVNPYDTSTYCDDAGAYRFFWLDADNDNISDWYGRMYFVVSDSTAELIILYHNYDAAQATWITLCLVSAFSLFFDPSDTEDSLFLSLTGGSSSTSSPLSNQMLAFKRSDGTRIEGGDVYYRDALLAKEYEDTLNDGPIRERVVVTRAYDPDASWTQGRKGIVDPDKLSCVRSSLWSNLTMSASSKYFISPASTVVIPWENGVPGMY